MVELEVLPGGDVAPLQRGKALGELAEGVELFGADGAHRQLHADHLAVGLSLSVHALLEAEADELRLFAVAGHELAGLGGEVVKLLLEDRDYASRGVLTLSGGHEGILRFCSEIDYTSRC